MVKPRIVQVKHLHAHFTNSSLINWKHISTVRFDDAVDIKKKYDGASSLYIKMGVSNGSP